MGKFASQTDADLCSGQVIFRIVSIVLRPVADMRRKAEPNIQRVLKLRGDPSSARNEHVPESNGEDDTLNGPFSVDSFEIVQLQEDVEAQREEIERIGTTGFQVVASFETAIARFEQQMQQLNNSIDDIRTDGNTQRNDLKSLDSDLSNVKQACENNPVVSRLDQQLQTTNRVVTELRETVQGIKSDALEVLVGVKGIREELHQTKEENSCLRREVDEAKQVAKDGITTSKMYASEVSSLRHELAQLRSELAHEREQHPPAVDDSSIYVHQLDILASNMSKIGNRASQIESLQMEFELFRTRIQRLEARPSSTLSTSRVDGRRLTGDYSSQQDQSIQLRFGGSTRQKRPSTDRNGISALKTTPPKRIAISSDYLANLASEGLEASDERQSSPLVDQLSESPLSRKGRTVSMGRARMRGGVQKTKP